MYQHCSRLSAGNNICIIHCRKSQVRYHPRMGRRPLKGHVQQELPKTRKRDKNNQFRGGKRAGAGRPKLVGRRSPEPHTKRLAFKASNPVHIVMRVMADVGSLRTVEGFMAVTEARSNTLRLE